MSNAHEEGNVAFILVSTALVFIMIPGLGYFYSGMAHEKNALSLLLISIISLAVVMVQWFLIGFSLCFSTTGGPFLGDHRYAVFMNVGTQDDIVPGLPNLAFSVFQGMFAAITPALAIGAIAERFSLLPTILFIFCWTTLVYDPIAYWTWGANGWLNQLGALDFAGGTPVHISSGVSGLALALFLGERSDKKTNLPHSMSHVVLGTSLLWFGWSGFNAGSEGAATSRAALALMNTYLAACFSGFMWLILEYVRERRVSALGFCSGAVAGLVCITPACGFVGPASSFVFGGLGALCCFLAVQMKHRFLWDDTLDVFAIHGIGGILGCFLTGIFAEPYFIGFSGVVKPGGAIAGHPIQIAYQLAGIGASVAWAFTITVMILFLFKILGLNLRVTKEQEEAGIDHSQIGEFTFDYVRERVSSSMDLLRSSKNAPTTSSSTSPSSPPPASSSSSATKAIKDIPMNTLTPIKEKASTSSKTTSPTEPPSDTQV